jgi:16S rRNA (adenine1518-N6/adenine1519-N6)-dimethyltransferase
MDNFSDDLTGRNLDQTGQHYMIDKSLIGFVIGNADLDNSDIVLEIGYGRGALTIPMAKKCKIIAVDIEKNNFSAKNVVFVQGNILDLFDELYSKYKFNKVVANIPYNISEPLMKLLFKHNLDLIVLTVGKNFAELLARPDNRIGIIASNMYDVELLREVKPSAFNPRPRVDSAVISLEPKFNSMSKIYQQLVLLDDKKLKNAMDILLSGIKTRREIKQLTTNSIFEKKLYELSNKEFELLNEYLNEWIV